MLRLDRSGALAAARPTGFAQPGDRLPGPARRLLTPEETWQLVDPVGLRGAHLRSRCTEVLRIEPATRVILVVGEDAGGDGHEGCVASMAASLWSAARGEASRGVEWGVSRASPPTQAQAHNGGVSEYPAESGGRIPGSSNSVTGSNGRPNGLVPRRRPLHPDGCRHRYVAALMLGMAGSAWQRAGAIAGASADCHRRDERGGPRAVLQRRHSPLLLDQYRLAGRHFRASAQRSLNVS